MNEININKLYKEQLTKIFMNMEKKIIDIFEETIKEFEILKIDKQFMKVGVESSILNLLMSLTGDVRASLGSLESIKYTLLEVTTKKIDLRASSIENKKNLSYFG